MESELFGHERGAFTGAEAARAGWFETAHGGTLFLDEVGDLPPRVQVKLLRVLQEREIVRLGARRATPIDVRLVAATHVDLVEAVRAGHFREDLYYRLAVAVLPLAPLRERPGDILPLARHFASWYAARVGRLTPALTPEAERSLLEHAWPGNVRELENAIHHALLVATGPSIGPQHLRWVTSVGGQSDADGPASSPGERPREKGEGGAFDELAAALTKVYERDEPGLFARIEEVVFRTAFAHCERNQVHTARLLGLSRSVARARLIHHGHLVVGARAATVQATNAEALEESARPLRVGFQKFGILGLLKARGCLERRFAHEGWKDVKVSWREFPGGLQLVEALNRDEIDLGVVGEAPPIYAQASGEAAKTPLLYLAAEAPAPGGEAIIVPRDSPLRTLRDLRGKTVALARGANVEYLMLRALEEADLSARDTHLAYVPPAGARAAFESGEVDAWAIWNPHLAVAAGDLGARVLRDARGLATNQAFYVGRRGFVEAQPDLVVVFLEEVRQLGLWTNDHLASATEMLSRELGLARSFVTVSLAGCQLGAAPLDEQTMARQQEVAGTFHRHHLLPRLPQVSDAVWAGFK